MNSDDTGCVIVLIGLFILIGFCVGMAIAYK